MTFAHTWLRQAFGAAGASLLAPIAILVAAGTLAAGGGLGGLSGLGQITSGPTLPSNEATVGPPAIAEADIVGADLDSTGGPGAVETSPGGAAVGAPEAFSEGPGGTAPLPSPLVDVPGGPAGGGNVTTPPPVVEPGQPPTPVVPPDGPARGLVETTRGVQMVVPESIRPVTEDIFNLLLGPPQP